MPHYSTISRRAVTLTAPKLARRSGGPLHLAVDATGLKVCGKGEWKARVHGKDKRRGWRKLHLAVDTRTGALLARTDAPITAVCADKACGGFDCHAAILARDARPVIPPRKGAAIHPPPGRKDVPPRGEAVARIAEVGRGAWKAEIGYHRRSLAETAMLRYRMPVGPNLRSRNFDRQKFEAAVAARCINRFTALGMPRSIRIA